MRSYSEQALAFLPRDAEEVVEARVWLAWCDLWRCSEPMRETVRDARAYELGLLDTICGYEVPRPELDGLYAQIEKLTAAVCAPLDPMPLATARALLAAAQERAASAAARSSETMRSGSSAE